MLFIGGSRYISEIACLTNDVTIVTLFVIADLMLGVSLAVASYKIFLRRKAGYILLPHQTQLGWVLGTLLSVSYFADVLVIFEGAYRLEVLIRGAAAGVSTVFAFSFWIKRG